MAQPRFRPGSIPPAEAGGLLTIDLGALASNWRRLRDRAAGAQCAAVVKADAYGLGIEKAVPALLGAGCSTFFVAHLSEALRIRQLSEHATVYVLNSLLPGTAATYAAGDLRPVLGSGEEIEEWAAFCRAESLPGPAAIHVDTGMNRLGLTVSEGLALAGDARLKAFEPALLMSHFAAAEEAGSPVTARQIDAFATVRHALPEMPASIANSAGIFLPEAPHYDLVRPGYALYGGNPTPGHANPMSAVVRVEGRVIQLRWVQDGDAIGYNGQWTAQGRRRLATVSIGYADGYPRAASSTDTKVASSIPVGEAIVAGRRCPFAGRVSMDMIILDVTEVPERALRRGDPVVFLGDDLTLDEVGARAGTIGYEVLTSLGRRYARTYSDASR